MALWRKGSNVSVLFKVEYSAVFSAPRVVVHLCVDHHLWKQLSDALINEYKSLGVGLILGTFSIMIVIGSHLEPVIFLAIGSWLDSGISYAFHFVEQAFLEPNQKVVGFAHHVCACVEPVHMSCRKDRYCSPHRWVIDHGKISRCWRGRTISAAGFHCAGRCHAFYQRQKSSSISCKPWERQSVSRAHTYQVS